MIVRYDFIYCLLLSFVPSIGNFPGLVISTNRNMHSMPPQRIALMYFFPAWHIIHLFLFHCSSVRWYTHVGMKHSSQSPALLGTKHFRHLLYVLFHLIISHSDLMHDRVSEFSMCMLLYSSLLFLISIIVHRASLA